MFSTSLLLTAQLGERPVTGSNWLNRSRKSCSFISLDLHYFNWKFYFSSFFLSSFLKSSLPLLVAPQFILVIFSPPGSFTALPIHLNVLFLFSFSVFWKKNKNKNKQIKIINRETHNWRMFSEWMTLGALVVTGCLHQTPPFKTQISMLKRTKKGCESQR